MFAFCLKYTSRSKSCVRLSPCCLPPTFFVFGHRHRFCSCSRWLFTRERCRGGLYLFLLFSSQSALPFPWCSSLSHHCVLSMTASSSSSVHVDVWPAYLFSLPLPWSFSKCILSFINGSAPLMHLLRPCSHRLSLLPCSHHKLSAMNFLRFTRHAKHERGHTHARFLRSSASVSHYRYINFPCPLGLLQRGFKGAWKQSIWRFYYSRLKM